MADRHHARQLRAALSYRQKVRRLMEEADEAIQQNRIDSARYQSLRQFYHMHQLRAEAALAKVRHLLDKEHDQLRARVAQCEQDRDTLSIQAASGEVARDAAQRRHRALSHDIASARERLDQLERLLRARDPMALGGFIDMPLDDYDIEPPPTNSRTAMGLRWTIVFAGCITASTIFLPWFATTEGRWPLTGVAEFITRIQSYVQVIDPRIEYVWVIVFAAALIALPTAAIARNRIGGLTTILGGIVIILAGVSTVLLIGYVAYGSRGMTFIVSRLQPAFYGYLFFALMTMALGWIRFRLRGDESITVYQLTPAAAFAIAGIFLCIASVSMRPPVGRIALMADARAMHGGTIDFTLSREGQDDIVVHIPWPELSDDHEFRGSSPLHVGINVNVRMPDTSDFRFLPDSTVYWDTAPLTPAAGNAFSLGGGDALSFAFDLNRLQSGGVRPETIRFDLSDARGRVYDSVGIDVPAPATQTQPQTAKRPAPIVLQPTPQPDPTPMPVRTPEPPPEPAPAMEPEPVPAEPIQRPATAPQREPRQTTIRFTGQYSSQQDVTAIFDVTTGRSEEQVNAITGQTIHGAWYLEKIESRPARAILRHRGTGDTITVHRRDTITLPSDRD